MIRTRVGYTGGGKEAPTYRDLGDHSEAVQVDFDPRRIAYRQLLAVFWSSHDPAVSAWAKQYRAAVFFHHQAQRREAEASREELARRLGEEVRTDVLPAGTFWLAEGYHQKWYLRRRGGRWLTWLQERYPTEAALRDATEAARLNGWLGGHGAPPAAEEVAEELRLELERARLLVREVAGR